MKTGHRVADLLAPEIALAELDDDSAPESTVTDGRVARGQRTRRNVAEALIELLREGATDPTARAVAQRAGVSLRLVFHHFTEMDDLYYYVAALQLRRQWSQMPRISTKLALATRRERTVAHRATLYEDISPIRRALVRRMPTSNGVTTTIAASDTLLLENLKETFAPELADLSPSARLEVIEGMDLATSWESWERMRTTSQLQVRGAKRVMTRMLEALCTPTAAVSPTEVSQQVS
jgi:TetR/AcrR family transcriptional regulator, regulator of autoinduction and epiphytic fitness